MFIFTDRVQIKCAQDAVSADKCRGEVVMVYLVDPYELYSHLRLFIVML
jgi:hypothetical protein